MKDLLRLLHFNFIPRSPDFALLVLRAWLGVSMLVLHGWGKLTGFRSMSGGFPDPLGVGSPVSLALATFAEVVCAVLVVIGLGTRFAALVLAILTVVAFSMVHGTKLSGAGNGELAFVYLAGFVAIFLAGPGRFSLDAKAGGA
jgi:Predicted membrane protein